MDHAALLVGAVERVGRNDRAIRETGEYAAVRALNIRLLAEIKHKELV